MMIMIMMAKTVVMNTTVSQYYQKSVVQTVYPLVGFLGFTLLHIGLCQPKYTTAVIISNFISSGIAVISSWIFGFAFAFGSSSNSFVSYSEFFLIGAEVDHMITWINYCSLAVLFTTVYNGGFLERLPFPVYAATATLLTGVIFPVACHWCWHENGFLKVGFKNSLNTEGTHYHDSGGLGPIHISAGSIALIGGLFLRARHERLLEPRFYSVPGKTNLNVFLGGFLSLVSLLTINNVLTKSENFPCIGIISSLTSSLVAIMFKRSRIVGEVSNVKTLINGALVGVIAVSAGEGDSIKPSASFGIGIVSGIVYIAWSVALKHFRFDDAVDTVAVHLGGGIWGAFAYALVHKSKGVLYVGSNESFKWLGWTLVAVLVYTAWAGLATIALMLPLYCLGKLRYSNGKVYEHGIDVCIHGEPAYPDVRTLAIASSSCDRTCNTPRIVTIKQKQRKTVSSDNNGFTESIEATC